MLINLQDAQPLGHWDISERTSQLEFQFGSKLVYVQYSKGASPKPMLEAAQKSIQEICINSDYPCYHIARDPCFEFERLLPDELDLWKEDHIRVVLPYFPDTDAVSVCRIGKHQFEMFKP